MSNDMLNRRRNVMTDEMILDRTERKLMRLRSNANENRVQAEATEG